MTPFHQKGRLPLLIFALLFTTPLLGQQAWDVFLPEKRSSHPEYRKALAEKERLRRLVDLKAAEADTAKLSENTRFYLNLLLNDLPEAKEARLEQKMKTFRLEKPLRKFNPAFLFELEQRLIAVNSELERWEEVYRYSGEKMSSYPLDTGDQALRSELSFYKLAPGDVIGEIGAGDERFAATASLLTDSLTFFLNDIDSFALFRITYHLQYNPVFSKGNSSFQLLLGKATSTGLESRSVDKIIVRNAFHHFSRPREMLRSIRHSIEDGGSLFIKERFLSDCGDNCCEQAMEKQTLKNLLNSEGFELMAEATFLDANHQIWHLFQFQPKEVWPEQ